MKIVKTIKVTKGNFKKAAYYPATNESVLESHINNAGAKSLKKVKNIRSRAINNKHFALAERNALSATYAFRIINLCLAVNHMDGIVVAVVFANLAADALVFLNPWLSSSVHVSFACYTTRPQALDLH